MGDLADFLLARLAETEAVAKAATPGPWLANGAMDQNSQVGTGTGVVGRTESFPGVDPRGDVVDTGVEGDGGAWYPDAVHIARHDPARVLAECDAKRRIVEIESRWRRTKDIVATSSGPGFDGLTHVTWHDADGRPHEETVTSREFRDQFTEPSPPSETLRLLALPYADHPDYREEWKP